MQNKTTQSIKLTDEELFNALKTNDVLSKMDEESAAYGCPGNTVLAIAKNTFMRKDETQVVFYGRMFLDFWSFRLTPQQAIVLALINGERSLDDISLLLQKNTGGTKELNDFKIRHVLACVKAFGKNPPRFLIRNDHPTVAFKQYDPSDFIIQANKVKLKIDLDKPISMLWMPTSVCQTNCIYCYATRRPVEQSELLSDERVKELFDEAADIGICHMNVDGGDALCRKNVEDLFAYAASKDIIIDLSTKAYISERKAKKLLDAGIYIMQIGFDAPTPDLFDKSVGKKGHFQRTIESIHNCVNAGITVRTNSILTQLTYSHIHELIELLHTLPLRDMKIATAFRTVHRYKQGILLEEEQKKWLREQISILQEKYPEGKIKFECQSDYMAMTDEERESQFRNFPRCAIGRDSMIITPDGKVAMCEQSPHTKELIVGDVKKNSIMDVWQSEKMKKFKNVTREQFRDTVCYDCDDFQTCFHTKGGCLIMAVKAYGTRFAPYPCCPKAPKYDIPIQ